MKLFRNHHRFLIAAALAIAVACSTKSPTEPTSAPISPKVPPPVTTFAITVTANPNHLTIGQTTGSQITVSAVDIQTGLPPGDLTPITVTTTLGAFGSAAGPTSITVQLVHGQAQTVLFPGTIAGAATVSAAGPTSSTGGTVFISGATTVTISSAGTFFLSSVSPTTGDPSGGIPVTIFGGGFVAPVTVSFGGSSAAVRSVSASAIVVTLPPSASPVAVGSTLQVSVTVTNNVGGTQQASATLTNAFTYVPGGGGIQQPQVFSVTPASGTNDGGTQVTITGQGFVAPVQVFFGSGASATSFNGIEATVRSVTATQIIAVTPPARGFGQDNTNQLVNILVKNLGSGFATVDTAGFKYGSKVIITSLAPTTTRFDQPVKVTVFGQGFADPVAVSLAGIVAQVLSTSGTEIQVLSGVPHVSSCADIKGPVHVVNINNGDFGDGPDFIFLVPKPVVGSVSPAVGPDSGGTVVTITGLNFDPPFNQVIFGTSAGSLNVGASSTTTLIVTSPPFTGLLLSEPCPLPGGANGTKFIPTAVDIIVNDALTGCTSTLKGGFTYLPSDTSCRGTPPPPVVKPMASFTFTSVGLKVAFHDTSSNTPTSWTWDFGDGMTSTVESPVHTYAAAGTYLVLLTACNSAGCDTASAKVTVP
jgi:hypothetical protein